MVLGLLLARAGVDVTVLEKHDDFLRDFRGDTVHASTLTLLDELGLGERFAAMPHRELDRLQLVVPSGGGGLEVDLRRLPGPHKHIAMVPQWDLLDLLADAAREEPSFTLRMGVEVTGLVREGGRVAGVRHDGGELRADLVVGCDGRSSDVRAASGLRVREFGVPLDVWWFRLPRGDDDPAGLNGRVGDGAFLALIDRGTYFQAGYVFPKGGEEQLRAEGVEAFRRRVAALAPELADRVDAVGSLDDDVRLLSVRLNRMPRWCAPGLLCIGDAAHAMSPVGGVGINLAVQDAVAAGRVLAGPLRRGEVAVHHLARVQARRWGPTVATQGLQRLIHRFFIAPRLEQEGEPARPPRVAALLERFPALQAVPATVVAIGVLPEHAPAFARR
jgi:2-polyprenyl-6-methoxyphenol hydroxylase-like FAD-dependent oxidoreductase